MPQHRTLALTCISQTKRILIDMHRASVGIIRMKLYIYAMFKNYNLTHKKVTGSNVGKLPYFK